MIIEQRPALDVLAQCDSPETLHYLDPPYVWDTRVTSKVKRNPVVYRHEMSDDDHRELAAMLHAVRGMVVLSGYPSALYNELYADWPTVTRQAHADGAAKRIEVLWIKPGAESHTLWHMTSATEVEQEIAHAESVDGSLPG